MKGISHSYCDHFARYGYYLSWEPSLFIATAVTFSINHSDRVTAVSESLKQRHPSGYLISRLR